MNIFMRIGFHLDVNSSHVTSCDVSTKGHLVISPNIWEENIQAWGVMYHQHLHTEKTFQLNGEAYTSRKDNEVSKIANSVPQNH